MEHLPDQLIELTSALSGVLAGLSENQRALGKRGHG
jgi:hypothetical protein